MENPEYAMLYSGLEERTGQFWTGLMINKNIRNFLLGFEAVSDKICKLKITEKMIEQETNNI